MLALVARVRNIYRMAPGTRQTPWLSYYRLNTHASVRLICLPPLGGGVHIFHEWKALLPSFIGVYAVQFPGRGNRLGEPSFTRMVPLVEALCEALQPHLATPFAIFGHSMGAIVGFELARQLRRSNIHPVHLFVSGSCAPQNTNTERPIHKLSDRNFIKEVRLHNEISKEVFEQPELVSLILPALRADFEIFHHYNYKPETPLDCSITAFAGRRDPGLRRSCLKGWSKHTNGEFAVQMIDGDHELTGVARQELLASISGTLNRYAPEQSRGKPPSSL